MAHDSELPEPLPAGYRFHDRFVIEAELPSLSMGRVYRALDSADNQVVALNLLSPSLRDEEGAGRFRMRFEKAQAGQGEAVRAYAECQGVPYIVLKYVEGLGAALDVGTEV